LPAEVRRKKLLLCRVLKKADSEAWLHCVSKQNTLQSITPLYVKRKNTKGEAWVCLVLFFAMCFRVPDRKHTGNYRAHGKLQFPGSDWWCCCQQRTDHITYVTIFSYLHCPLIACSSA
jgi:hypothetical protein